MTDADNDALGILITWANEQPHWIRHTVSEVLANRRVPDADGLDAIFQRCLSEFGLNGQTIESIAQIERPSSVSVDADPLYLTSISDVVGVNKLKTGQTIEFNPKLTVLYGENATGKTGYVRILKRIAKVRSAVPVLGDASSPTPSQIGAKLSYRIGAKSSSFDWRNEEGVPPFGRMSVFDLPAVTLHVDGALPYVYTPRDLDLFRLVTDSINTIKGRLNDVIEQRRPGAIPFLASFDRDTPVYATLQTLGAASDLSEINALGTLTEDQEAQLPQLRQNESAFRPEAISSRLALARTEKDLYGDVHQFLERVRSISFDEYEVARVDLEQAEQRFHSATEDAFAGIELPGVLTEVWADFIRSGESYISALDGSDYPSDEDVCVYCRQPLEAAALSLLTKYREYCNNKFSQDVSRSKRDLEARVQVLEPTEIESLSRRVAEKIATFDDTDTGPQLLGTVREILDEILAIASNMRKGDPIDPTETVGRIDSVLGTISTASTNATQLSDDLAAERDKRDQLHAKTLQDLKTLEARVRLKSLLPDVIKYVDDAKWTQLATQAVGRFATHLRSLTIASSQASNDLMNREFEKHFRNECDRLRAPNVDLNFPGRGGEATRNKVLYEGHRLSEILSEGEQKVIAIADFLSEAAIGSRNGPVIFDDPTTSLDHRRLREIAARIVNLSNECQVIVFTHDIWLATELLSKKEELGIDGCTYYEVRETDYEKGLVISGTHPRWDTQNNLKKELNSLIDNARSATGTTQDVLVESAYDTFRAWCEVVVEQTLLAQVCQRFQPNVQMGSMKKIRVDRLQEAINAIHPLWEKANRYIKGHSQPLQTLGVRPRLPDLVSDWNRAQEAVKKYNSA